MRTVLEKLTLEQTIRFHRHMWREIAQFDDQTFKTHLSVEALKKRCQVWRIAGINPNELAVLCFPCQYVTKMRQLNAQHNLRQVCSWECPVIWKPHGICLVGIYSDFITALDNDNWRQARKLAAQIAEIRFKTKGYYGRAVTRLLTKKELAKR